MGKQVYREINIWQIRASFSKVCYIDSSGVVSGQISGVVPGDLRSVLLGEEGR